MLLPKSYWPGHHWPRSYTSRISNSRICIYLNRKTTAQDLVTNHRTITINNVHTTVRPLINPSQKIILSNVSPSIPHEYIEKFFTHNNVRMTSKLPFLRAGIHETGFTHIMSFRRQVFINPDDLQEIPQSFLINHDNTQYRIFASTDKLNCFICKQEGHVAIDCNSPSQPTTTNQEKTLELNIKHTQHSTHEHVNTENDSNTIQTSPDIPPPPPISNKINNDITNNSQKSLPETGDQMTTDLPNNKRPLSVCTEPSLDDGNEYPPLARNVLNAINRLPDSLKISMKR